jgi:hypothetical protein
VPRKWSIRRTWIALVLSGVALSSAFLGCQALLNRFRNTIVISNASSMVLDSFVVDTPDGRVELGPLDPGQNRRTRFWSPAGNGELAFVVTRGPQRYLGSAGTYLDGTSSEVYKVTVSDEFEYSVATVYQYARDGKRRMEHVKVSP